MDQPSSTMALQYREAMSKVAAAVHVVTTEGHAGRYGITLTAVMSVTDTPPTLLLCINRNARIQPILRANGQLCVNVLAASQQDVAEHFAGLTSISASERFLQNEWQNHHHTTQPQLVGALAHLHGHIIDSHDMGSHSVFYVAIEHINVNSQENQGLLYFQRQFAQTAVPVCETHYV
ncbi:4-hydroxyphenylacetate 3-monooxygenase, reductase component [Snodgrassella alvi]|uniref:4-hydroxyphenylacetate 3-monooxygenase reductase component n=1 Tax=Snodgrassella alvi TaxID=1196083 RepID=A0A2N9Y016_9NEIS|nr:4-hydroxyphenylacetate 3-monooxygenase, reductase component [Snodgrassella alvi]PIT57999.1 4-hydroxyphenylacetate 3-monooxygenase, reductase component [Snodgrassella alvi]PIT58034.1 4-hydroxyphenylacetate 3-monooxygenase, reductase component [Snodgrassella alvi]